MSSHLKYIVSCFLSVLFLWKPFVIWAAQQLKLINKFKMLEKNERNRLYNSSTSSKFVV